MPYKDLQKKREYNKQWMGNKHKGISNSITMNSMNDYPLIKIPKNMKETQYPGYYITEEGKWFSGKVHKTKWRMGLSKKDSQKKESRKKDSKKRTIARWNY